MVSPTNTVLLAMAVCDLLTIIIPTPWFDDDHDDDGDFTPPPPSLEVYNRQKSITTNDKFVGSK